MKSSIKIDFVDRGTGKGCEPVIRVELKKSEDPRDTLIAVLFESLREERFFQFVYSHHKHIATSEGLPDMEKQILIFKPEQSSEEIETLEKEFAKKIINHVDELISKGLQKEVVPFLNDIQFDLQKRESFLMSK